MHSRTIAVVAAAAALLAGPAWAQGAGVAPGDECAHIFAETGVPVVDADIGGAAAEPSHTLVCRRGYALYHNNTTHIPDWVAEDVTDDEIVGNAARKDNFRADPETPPPAGASLEDYRGSGFDRGHQAPAADFKKTQSLMDDSFFLSNMAPQVGSCFNRGVWAGLEADVRGWAETRRRLVVFTGPVYPDPLVTVGDVVAKKAGVDLAVPEAFYKVVYDPASRRSVAYLLPNEKLCGHDPGEFTTSIRHIRELTGIDFFPALDARSKRILERATGNHWGW